MITYNDKKYLGYLELFYELNEQYKVNQRELINRLDRIIPPSKVFFVKAALEEKFKRRFKFKEVLEIMKDRSWQWRKPSLNINKQLEVKKTHPWRNYQNVTL